MQGRRNESRRQFATGDFGARLQQIMEIEAILRTFPELRVKGGQELQSSRTQRRTV